MIFLIIIIITAATIGLIWKVPIWQLSKRKKQLELDKYLDLENEYRKTVAQIIGGLYVLGGFAFTWFQFLATQDTILISQERLITDRYSKAVDQLGSSNTSTRLGGIYALGSIEKTNPEYIPIVDNVLISYIRQHYKEDSSVNEELQASINVITRKQFHTILKDGDEEEINLSDIALNGFDFSNAVLQKAKLNGTQLRETIFNKANLSGVEATGTFFVQANLTGAILENNAIFYGADFTNAHLDNASMKNSNFKLAIFKEAHMSNADLSGSDLSEADFERAELYGANLQDTKGLTREQMKRALIDKNTKLPF